HLHHHGVHRVGAVRDLGRDLAPLGLRSHTPDASLPLSSVRYLPSCSEHRDGNKRSHCAGILPPRSCLVWWLRACGTRITARRSGATSVLAFEWSANPMRPAMKLTSGVFTLFAACAATPTMSSDELGFVHERIRLIGEPEADGAVYIGFELSAKTYWIDAKLSPDAAA